MLVFIWSGSFAQNEEDALRYSFLTPSGTARFSAMGGGFGALGADLSLTSQNPAGLAVYTRNSEFTITPVFTFNNSNSTYLDNNKYNDFSYGVQLNNLGLVLTFSSEDKKEGWVNTNFAITYNRLADFRSNIYASSINNTSSLADYFVQMANGHAPVNLYSFEEGLAFDAYLIDTAGSLTNYTSVYDGKYGEEQIFQMNSKGGIGEYSFAFAGNYEHKLFLGGAFNIRSINYSHKKIINEVDIFDSIPHFEQFAFTENLKTSGTGVNLNLGFIYRINKTFRFGLAFHSPTFYSMFDDYYTKIKNDFDTTSYDFSSPENKYKYSLITPARFVGSFGVVFARNGLLSLDVEGVDYRSAKLKSSDYAFVTENSNIQNLYIFGLNVRGGVEYNLGILALRGGVGYYSSPYKSDKDKFVMTYNGGVRIRGDKLYLDLTYSARTGKTTIYPYKLSDKPVETINANQTLSYFMATVGMRF